LTTWHCILSAELTQTHFFRLLFQRFFAHWVGSQPNSVFCLHNYNEILLIQCVKSTIYLPD